MLKMGNVMYIVEERYDIVDSDGFVVQTFATSPRTVFKEEDLVEIKNDWNTPIYQQACKYVKENQTGRQPLTFYRTLDIRGTMVQHEEKISRD